MKSPAFTILIFLFLQVNTRAQIVYFQKYFGTTFSDAGRSVTQTQSGDIYVAGYTAIGVNGSIDIALTKLDKNGNSIWTKYFGDSLNNYALGMTKNKHGEIVICGETEISTFDKDAFVLKIDSAGNLIWEKTFGNFQNQSLKSIEATLDGGFIACGFTTDPSNLNDIFIVKLDSNGLQQWSGTIGGSLNDIGGGIRQTSDGGYIVTGDSNSNNASNYDVEITKLDSAGNVVWDNFYGDSLTNGCQGILPLKDGSYLSYGETEIGTNSPFNFFMQKIDSAGNSIFRKTFGGTVSDALFSAVEATDGSFYFTGYSNSYHSGPIDLVFGKTDSLANLKWVSTFGDSSIDIGYQIIAAKDSGFLILGNGYHNGSDDFFLLYVNDSLSNLGIKSTVKSTSKFNISPNPASVSFSIPFAYILKGECFLRMTSITGEEIFSIKLTDKNNLQNISIPADLKNGIYFLSLRDASTTYYSKICIQK